MMWGDDGYMGAGRNIRSGGGGGGQAQNDPHMYKKKNFLVVSPVKNIHQVLVSKKFKIKFRYNISRVRSILEFR